MSRGMRWGAHALLFSCVMIYRGKHTRCFLPLLPHCQGAHLRVVIFIDIFLFPVFVFVFKAERKEKKGKIFLFSAGESFLLYYYYDDDGDSPTPVPCFFLSLLFVVVAPLAFLLSLLLIKWLSGFHLLQPSSLSLFFIWFLSNTRCSPTTTKLSAIFACGPLRDFRKETRALFFFCFAIVPFASLLTRDFLLLFGLNRLLDLRVILTQLVIDVPGMRPTAFLGSRALASISNVVWFSSAFRHCDSDSPDWRVRRDASSFPNCNVFGFSFQTAPSFKQEARGCPLPPEIANGRYQILPMRRSFSSSPFSPRTQHWNTMQQNGSAPSGSPLAPSTASPMLVVPVYSSALYSCQHGFLSGGSSLISCSPGGWWQPTHNAPRCLPFGPASPSNGVHHHNYGKVRLMSVVRGRNSQCFPWHTTRRWKVRLKNVGRRSSDVANSSVGSPPFFCFVFVLVFRGRIGGVVVCLGPVETGGVAVFCAFLKLLLMS